MSLRRWKRAAALPVLLMLAGAIGSYALRRAPGSLELADSYYTQKSYARALKIYESLLKAGAISPGRRDEVEYRIAVSLGKTLQWDRALEESLAFVKGHARTVWEPRGLYWLGRLYLGIPHQGWRVGTHLYRGQNVPKTDADATPEQVDLTEQDSRNARDALEAACVFYTTYERIPGVGGQSPLTPREAQEIVKEGIQLDFDLARVLDQDDRFTEWAQKQRWARPADPVWQVDPAAVYDPEWAPPKKQLYLYENIRSLTRRQRASKSSDALALLAKALWLRRYHNQMASCAIRQEGRKQVRIPYPYEKLNAGETLSQLIHTYPDSPIRDQAQFTRALFLEQDGRYLAAEEAFRQLIAERPASRWVSDARAALQQIARRDLALNATAPQLPGRAAHLQVQTRNVRRIRFEVYRVNLEEAVSRLKARGNPGLNMNAFFSLYGSIGKAHAFYGPRVAALDRQTKDRGDHRMTIEDVSLPVKRVGAYVVVASAPGVKAASLLLITDLAIVRKTHRDGTLFFATDARTGAPAHGVEIVAEQTWYQAGQPHTAFTHGTTDARGLVTIPFLQKAGRSNFTMMALAYRGDRYAVTDAVNLPSNGDNPGTFRVYSTTDRAVYRPQQTVFYRQLLMRRTAGDWKPVVGRNVRVEVNNPNGEKVYATTARSSTFGSVNGHFTLVNGAPLGEYSIHVRVHDKARSGLQDEGESRFRVEEYKKPEFEVSVVPEAERVRLGQPTSARVVAKYYFGGPVPSAQVKYRVYRNSWAQQYEFPHPYDFLYRTSNAGDDSSDYRSGEVVKQGEAITDEKGEARIEFPTRASDAPRQQSDQSYTIEADVQDASRRVISGTGAVKATQHDVAVFLDFPHGYATQGDRVDVAVRTLNPSDRPVSVSGVAKVFRRPDRLHGKETEVFEAPLKTDAAGRAVIHWTAKRAGAFRVAFETRDSAEQRVVGSLGVWVDGPELAQGRFLFRDLFMAVKNPYYQEGETARVLLITPAPGCTVLLTREADNEILEERVVTVPGRSLEVTIPIVHRDAPNVYLSAILIRNNRAYQATQELYVPSAHQFAHVTVEADRARYEPGQKARLRLQARDWQGRPLRTELSVSVSDASLAYIQKDYAPDIRSYFYGDERSQSVEAGDSTGVSFEPQAESTQRAGSFHLHTWQLPDGMGQISDWPGRNSLNYPDYYSADDFRSTRGDSGVKLLQAPKGLPLEDAPPELSIANRSNLYALNSAKPAPMMGNDGVLPAKMAPRVDSLGTATKKMEMIYQGVKLKETVRTRFADTAFWTPAIVTNANGAASVTVTWPDNLTQWRAHAVGNSAAAQVGSGETRVVTRKDLLVRLQAPRSFVERDQLTLSANVHNYAPNSARVKVTLNLGSDAAEIAGSEATQTVEIPKDGEQRVDWIVHVLHEGTLRVRMAAQSATASDAMEETLPVVVHGVERATAQSGVLRQESRAQVPIELPEARKPGSSELVVQLNPSLGAVMLDALPYLIDYPYGCIEQTTSRFIPCVVVAKTLKEAGYDLEALGRRARQLQERARRGGGSRPVENSPYTYPQGQPGALRTQDLSAGLERAHSPVFDSVELNRMVAEGLQRIRGLQRSDGGWGWWPDDSSDPTMSAYVLYGLLTAHQAGYTVDAALLTHGIDYLKTRFREEDNFSMLAEEARVLAMDAASRTVVRPIVTGRLYDRRERLSDYAKALLAMALYDVGDRAKAGVVLDNLETTAQVDEANGTASWGESAFDWWHWWNDRVETNATVLQAYMKIRPTDRMAPMLMKWLVNNRRGNIWSSTRETAMAVYALADYTRVNRELAPEYRLTVDLGGRVQRSYTVTHENALFFDNTFVVPDALLQTGAQTLTIIKSGPGTLYYAAYTRYFSLEEPIRATGKEISVRRRYFRLLPGTASGTPPSVPMAPNRPNPFLTRQYALLTVSGEEIGDRETEGGPRYERVALRDGESVKSGDLLEVELQLESKNDYDYLVFEDMKPSGCEPVEVRSGGRLGLGVYSNMELRDQKVAFFLSSLPQGTRTLSYRLYAEIPGRFHVLPTNGYAMYAPDVRTLSDEMGMGVE